MKNEFIKISLILVLIITTGIVGYWAIEGWNLLDSVFMTVITLTTIGYGEVYKLNPQGKIFTIILIVFGVAGAGYAFRILGQMIIEGQFKKYLGKRIMEKNIQKLADHYIVCGFGRVGKAVCEELNRNGVGFVVIEKEPEIIQEMEQLGYTFISGNCDDDDNLLAAGIQKAKGLINTLALDADAVYVTLSAKQLNPKLFIMARADNPSAETKLMKAGATKVLSPHVSAGVRMAQTTIRPNVVDFMTLTSGETGEAMKIEEIAIKEGSRFANTNLKDSGIRSQFGITVIGAKKKGVQMFYNPPPEFQIEVGDTLIMVGAPSQLEKLEKSTGS
jgi:voltage-gated potassium channel